MIAATPLADRQTAFMKQLLAEGDTAPAGWTDRQAVGFAIYRNNYRTALVDALADTYEKTARWVGEDAFRRAAAHHVITNPPKSWTLDEAGVGFDRTCSELFGHDPEVAELAWLEWAMLQAFVAADVEPLDAPGFARQTSGFGETQWARLRLKFLPAASTREVEHDMRAIWSALGEGLVDRNQVQLESRQSLLVWREGERATFMMASADEARAFTGLASGMPYGELCLMLAGEDASDEAVQRAAMRAGSMLGRWIGEGLITGIEC